MKPDIRWVSGFLWYNVETEGVADMVFSMVLKMTAVTAIYVTFTVILWKKLRDKQMTSGIRIAIGVLYGLLSIMSTHFGINYGDMVLNVRDLGPLSAGLFFDPVSGIIAGLMGGIERYIAGTYWDIGSFTRIACSISTCLAGFLAAFLKKYIFKGKMPGTTYAAFMGALIEVFHMYVVFITHRTDMDMAYYVVQVCSIPMILFSSLGLAATALLIRLLSGEWRRPSKGISGREIPVTHRFQMWLFAVTTLVFALNFGFEFDLQTQAALQKAQKNMLIASEDAVKAYETLSEEGVDIRDGINQHIGTYGHLFMVSSKGELLSDPDTNETPEDVLALIKTGQTDEFFEEKVLGDEMLCRIEKLQDGTYLVMAIPMWEVYETRNAEAYETVLSDILVFSVIYVLISLLLQYIVVNNLYTVNESLRKITEGDLDEKVQVYNSSEFSSLSDDINQTVHVLKGYISAAEKRIEQELLLARSIQDSALPKNFHFRHGGFEIYATMDPAREVGGDFYDFYFVETDMLALVIADVSGKGIPASLFMMRSKTTIRGLAETGKPATEVFGKTNDVLCISNDASMFVTAWIGIIDLKTGIMKCVNAGHEYPALMRAGGSYELYKRKHNPALGVIEDIPYTEYELRLEPGDCIFVYTDGVPEAVNENQEQFGTERMLQSLNDNKSRAMEEILPAVKADIDSFVGKTDQFDDITMLGFRYNGPRE